MVCLPSPVRVKYLGRADTVLNFSQPVCALEIRVSAHVCLPLIVEIADDQKQVKVKKSRQKVEEIKYLFKPAKIKGPCRA